MSAMHIGLSYVERNAYKQLAEYPLKITQGDIHQNLEELQSFAGQVDSQTANILRCMVDPGVGRTLEAMRFLRQAPGSIALNEKGHAPGAILKRQHKSLEADRFLERAFVHLHAPLFKASKEELKVSQLQERYQAILAGTAAGSKKLSGKMVFFSDLFSGRVRVPDEFRDACPKTLLQQHHRWYGDLDLLDRQGLAARAAVETAQKRMRVMNTAPQLLADIHLLVHKLDEKKRDPPNTVHGCRYPDASRLRLLELVETLRTPMHDKSYLFGREAPPLVPSLPVQTMLKDAMKEFSFDFKEPPRPWWAKVVAACRDHFRCSLIWCQPADIPAPTPSVVFSPQYCNQQNERHPFLEGRRVELGRYLRCYCELVVVWWRPAFYPSLAAGGRRFMG